MKNAVVIFLRKRGGHEVLLAQKHSGSEIAGLKWNGYGGKMEPGENVRQATIRETDEESDGSIRLSPADLKYHGVVEFYNSDKVANFRVHFLLADNVITELPKSTEVMIDPQWFWFSDLPWSQMMPADKLILPLILEKDLVIEGRVVFEPGFKGVKDFSYRELTKPEIEALLAEVQK